MTATAWIVGWPPLAYEMATVVMAPLTQVTGLIVALTGASQLDAMDDVARSSRPKVVVTPTTVPGGVGVGLSITRW